MNSGLIGNHLLIWERMSYYNTEICELPINFLVHVVTIKVTVPENIL